MANKNDTAGCLYPYHNPVLPKCLAVPFKFDNRQEYGPGLLRLLYEYRHLHYITLTFYNIGMSEHISKAKKKENRQNGHIIRFSDNNELVNFFTPVFHHVDSNTCVSIGPFSSKHR